MLRPFIGLVFSIFFISTSFAFNDSELREQYSVELEQIDVYLNQITTLVTNFVQLSKKDAEASFGVLYLQRPDKMCIDYIKGPISAKIISNGGILTYFDKELDEVTSTRTKNTPAIILLKKNISVRDVTITKIIKDKKEMRIIFFTKNDDTKDMMMVFRMDPRIQLHGISISDIDESGKLDMLFRDPKENIEIPSSVFVLARKGK